MNIDTAGRVAGVYKTGAYYVGAVETDATNRILYAPQGAIAQMRLGTGLWDQTRFNKRLQPTQMGVGTTTPTGPTGLDTDLNTTYANRLLLGNCYTNVDPNCSAAGTANNNGNVLRQLIQAPSLSLTQVFTYDPLNRLDSASESGGGTPWAQHYGYGRFGNRAVTGVGDYIPVPALTPISVSAYDGNTNRRNSAGYVYDLSGNMITEASSRTMTYDAENRMVTFYDPLIGTTNYYYDGDGRRVQKVSGGVTSVYVYNALGQLAAEYSSNPTFSGPGGTSYISGDHLGSTRLVINPDYSIRGRHDYLPFGEEIGTVYGGRGSISGYGAIEFRQKFTQKERDTESNLDFFLARYLSGPQGRFMTPDWAVTPMPVPYARPDNPQTLNLFAYLVNNPMNRVDRNGHDDFTYDQTGKEIEHVKRSKWHNFWVSNSYTMKAENGKKYSLDSSLNELPGGQKYTIVSPKITAALMSKFVWDNAPKAEDMNLIQFKNNSKTRGIFDFKQQLDQNRNALYALPDGSAHAADYIGNMTWGFLAAATAIPSPIAHMGAGYAQVFMDHTSKWSYWTTMGDDPRDYKAIDKGYDWFGTDFYSVPNK